MEDSVRRARLHEMDEILDALERLNLRDINTIPDPLRERLNQIGVPTPERTSVTELIERVWELQEQFLSSPLQGSEGRGSGSWRGRERI